MNMAGCPLRADGWLDAQRRSTDMKYLWGTLFALAVLFIVLGVIYLS